ncbi:MAG: response regulator transcription factor [Chloroflexi bacterium]|nr:response regulator transcription factor [Chloroflexota bacterium]
MSSLLSLDTGGRRLYLLVSDQVNEDLTRTMRRLRAAEGDCGVVVLCNSDDPKQVAFAVESGADDCILIHTDVHYLLARLRATAARLRRSQPPRRSPPEAGQIDVDPHAFEAKVGGKDLRLSPLQFRLLKFLWEHQGRVVGHDALEQMLWNDASAASRQSLKQVVSRLRKRLGPAAGAIRSVAGVGYLFK